MDEQAKLAFTFASELSKQLITLATGILALTITFTKDILRHVSARGAQALTVSWVFYFISIICGIWALLALTGTLAPLKSPNSLSETFNALKTACGDLKLAWNIRIPSLCQIISFLVATIMIIIYGAKSLVRLRSEISEKENQKLSERTNSQSPNRSDKEIE